MEKLIFNATKEQIQLAAALAADHAVPGPPTSLGWLHYDPDRKFNADEMAQFWVDKGDFKADYVQGRCTKFVAWDANERFYGDQVKGYKWMTGADTQPDYETWYIKYPTYEDLLRAAGITDFKRIGG